MVDETSKHGRILIVDDEAINVQLISSLLAKAGYTDLVSTTDARQVALLYTEQQPDLVLLDLRMPHRSGFEILADLHRLTPKDSFVPVLVLTADVASEALRRALEAGANDFLTKPFELWEFLLRIRNLLHTRFLHRALQDEKRVLEQRVDERTRQLLQMEKLSAMGQLLAGVAHEFNNPLTVVSGQAQLLRMMGAPPPVAECAEQIGKASERCIRIVRNFLGFAREYPPNRTSVDLNTVIGDAVDLLGYELRADGIEVRLDLAKDLPELWADPHQLHQVVVNLVVNSHHAMRDTAAPRTLTLTTQAMPPDDVRLTVADSGEGIPLGIQGQIFDPFFTTKPLGQGTGLGLSLSRGIIQDHAGTIRVESPPGQGATFVIDLPIGTPCADATDRHPPQAALAPKRILVVDDEADVAHVLVEMLGADGHQVDSATNGAEALAKLDRLPYDVILSDTRMPVLDGYGFFTELGRRHPELRRRVAFLTGDVLNVHQRDLLEQTGAPTLAKPFDLKDLRRIVHQLLDDDRPMPPDRSAS
jgi:signal transduction histidine kinase